ncbi:ATP-binding cassette domain-containing protein [Rhizobium rhizogenes]|uniref:ATP-binding cassette domain-containing protein n=1 Tax=Rhizobium rhizogenes TaxID=359 RepID=UPI0009DF60FC|nr:ATP-binding cassette domain-containing protein [Rhizobium rhizogenes]NTH23138.1 ATP-binding cassette domain-containing protein [Rhizobium rhizogenes]NTH36168.1 ATP-binding cassette domain-containing protein [Rhizobium rhizogenes]
MSRLHAQNISLAFGSTKTVAHAGVTIEAGKVIALIDANGACKPILAKHLFGLYRPDAGKALCQDKEFAQENSTEATASSIVAVRQSTNVVGISSLAVTETLPHNHFVAGRYPFFPSSALRACPAPSLHARPHLGHRIRRRSAQRLHHVETQQFYAQDLVRRVACAKN